MKLAMKLLTNIWWQNLAGITQYFIDFIRYNERSDNFDLYGVDIINSLETRSRSPQYNSYRKFKLIKEVLYYQNPHGLDKGKELSISIISESYKNIIDTYTRIVCDIKPDVILINGDGILSWCLLQAARRYKQAKIFVHYHGILCKEISHWPERDKLLVSIMERDFMGNDISYIFPSCLAKETVEIEVFGEKILKNKSIIIQNPISDEFIEHSERNRDSVRNSGRKIGIIGRWQKLKTSVNFIVALSECNNLLKEPFQITLVTDKKSTEIMEKYPKIGKVSFRKPMDREKLINFYTNQQVIICHSNFETYGNVAQESIVLGTPAFVSINMGVCETLKKAGLNSLVVDFDSLIIDDLLNRIQAFTTSSLPDKAISNLRKISGHNIFLKYSSFIMNNALDNYDQI